MKRSGPVATERVSNVQGGIVDGRACDIQYQVECVESDGTGSCLMREYVVISVRRSKLRRASNG